MKAFNFSLTWENNVVESEMNGVNYRKISLKKQALGTSHKNHVQNFTGNK